MTFDTQRIALHYHIPVFERDGDLFCPAYFGVWVDSMAQFFDEVVLIAHTCEYENGPYQIQSDNVRLLDLKEKPASLFRRIARFRDYQKLIAAKLDSFDCVGIRAPTPLAIFIYWVVRKKPVFFLLVGNLWRMSMFSKTTIWKKCILTAYWWIDHRLLSIAGNKATVFGNGPYFAKEFPAIKKIHVLFTSTIFETDIADSRKSHLRTDCLSMVYAGRIAPDKGIEYVIKAMVRLRNSGIDTTLSILGTGEASEINRLRIIVSESGVEDLVSFKGFIPHGKEFKSYLDNADVMVIPPIWDFQSRVIWEGMARGLPIIASRGIKSLPLQFMHKQEIYFVDPGDALQLAEAIKELQSDRELYRELSRASIRIAKERTVDKSAGLLVKGLKESEKFI